VCIAVWTPALPQADGILDKIICPATSSSVRKSEASIIELKDGRLLLAYTDFYTVSPDDDAPARILGRYSSDLGQTWSAPFTVVENTAGMNVMSVSLLRLRSGEVALAYMFKNSDEDCSVLFRLSRDEGRTFSEPVKITPRKSFWVMNNDRLVELRSGRLLAPCQRLDNWPMVRHSLTQVLYSDDKGKTWKGSELVDIRKNNDGADEPGVVELADGRILMFFRTALGSIYQSFSSDGGVTWTQPSPTSLAAPVSPSVIKRIPSTGDLLIVWNHTLPHARGGHSDRFPLTVTISRDSAVSWEKIRDFDTDIQYTFGYPSLTFVKDRILVTYWAAHDSWWYSLKIKSVPVKWLYQ
jgi:predicted neuraminidase